MTDDAQQLDITTPPGVRQLVPELADATLMAACDLRQACRKELDSLVRLYDKRYEKHRKDFLSQRRANKPFSKTEVTRFQRQWREYVRGVVEPIFSKARRTARMQTFVQEQQEALGCKLVGSVQAGKIVPFLNLKLLAQKGRLRQVQFEKAEFFHAEEDLQRIAVEDAEIIEKKREKHEADQRRKAREFQERVMKERLRHWLYNQDVDREKRDRILEGVLCFKSVRDLCETKHFMQFEFTFPEDCAEYIDKEVRAALGLEPDANQDRDDPDTSVAKTGSGDAA